MCGRYFRQSDKQRIAESLHVSNMSGILFQLEPCYNIAPQTFQLVVRADHETERELAFMRWGFIPTWAKDDRIGQTAFNVKAEVIASSPTYRDSFRTRRCLIPADGYFEWKQTGLTAKQPYAFGLTDAEPMAFGGLWSTWNDRLTRRPVETFCIITTPTNELTGQVTDRMPLIIAPADYRRWVIPGDPEDPPIDLLKPYPAQRMMLWKVSSEVTNARNNSPALIERAS